MRASSQLPMSRTTDPTPPARTSTELDNGIRLSPFQRRALLLLLGVVLLSRALVMLYAPFTDTTEARYAEIARKMVETGNWVTPQFDYGVPFWGKPPLHTWLSAAGIRLFGATQFGARVFIFLAAVALTWALYRWVRRVRGRDYALAGTAILVSSGLYYVAAATVMTDYVMLCGTVMCMMAFWNAMDGKGPAGRGGYLFFVGLAVGLLAKGPVAVALTALPTGLWVLWKNRWADAWRRLPWISGGLLTLALVLPWYWLAELRTPGFLHYFIVGEHWQRFLDSGWSGDLYGHGHARVRGSIWLDGLMTFMPWTPFLLAPLLRFGRLRRGFRADAGGWAPYLVCWALSPMLFFTAAGNILPTYVITGVPALAMLGVELWRMAGRDGGASPGAARAPSVCCARFFAASAFGFLVICAVACSLFILRPDFIARKSQKPLVRFANGLEAARGGKEPRIGYWKKRYYSAEFYSRGRAREISTDAGIGRLLGNGSRDFLVVRANALRTLPDGCLDRFRRVGEFGKVVLFREVPTASSEPCSAGLDRCPKPLTKN